MDGVSTLTFVDLTAQWISILGVARRGVHTPGCQGRDLLLLEEGVAGEAQGG